MNALIAFTFPALAAPSGGYPFLIFGVVMVAQFFVLLFFCLETKGYALEQMQAKLGIE